MPVTTRSGKQYNNTIQPTTRVVHCSFCDSSEHKISECNCERIETLHQQTIHATIFSEQILDSHAFLRLWLDNLTDKEIYIIGKHLGIGSFFKAQKSKKINDQFNFIKRIIEEYFHTDKYIPYSLTPQILYTIPDKTFILFQEILKENMPQETYNKISEIITSMMPQKKFNIRIRETIAKEYPYEQECPICFTNTNKEDTIKTNCQHTFCSECISQMFKASNQNNKTEIGCPYCRTTITDLQTSSKFTSELFNFKYCKPLSQYQPQPQHQPQNQIYQQITVFHSIILLNPSRL